jgi:Protein of unknown function (DUF2867)
MTKARAVPSNSLLAPLYAGADLVAGTVVHCHNRLGRIYLTTIAPFHRVIVQASLEQAARATRI